MIFPVKHLPVNWIDGMKVSKDNFIDTDKHYHDIIRDHASLFLTNTNFGLLPSPKGSRAVFDLSFIQNAANSITVKLNYCSAITPGGCRIFIEAEDKSQALSATIKSDAGDKSVNELIWYDVVVVVNPFDRVPMGNPDPEENPPRHPYSDNNYSLSIIPSDQLNLAELGAYYLVVGRIKNKANTFYFLENYIPPCTSVDSHPSLIDFYETMGDALDQAHNLSIKIIQKICNKNKPSSIAKNYKKVCEKILDFTTGIFFQYRNTIPQAAPVYLIDIASSLANKIHTALHCISTEEREELLKYIFEWCEITPNAFEEELLKAVEIQYNHYNIEEPLNVLAHFLKTVNTIWTKMNNLEYIGQRKENIVVKKEDVKQQVEQPKKRWSIVD
jgi:hypothetical protein